MPFKALREFIQLETSGGIILLATALLAIIFANTPLRFFYEALFDLPVHISIGYLEISKPLLLWVNDGLMTIFFLLVGLEIKREMMDGELNSLAKAALPGLAAVGGMVVPALIFILLNWGDPVSLRGWAIPTATDIAFSLGILALLGSRIPVSLKVFLTALAIFDDIGAIVIIAIFYTKDISLILLVVAAGFTFLLFVMNRMQVTKAAPYVLVGIALWLTVLKSGVHATLAGIVIAFCIPMHDPKKPGESPLRKLEHKLHPWVAFGVLPLFAFANAGVQFSDLGAEKLFSPITIGIAAGLFFGKQIGIWLASWLGVRFKIGRVPRGVNLVGLYGVSLIAGVGFTMSLFIGSLAYGRLGESYAEMVRFGVIVGSLFSGVIGYLVLNKAYPSSVPLKNPKRSQKKIN